MTDEDLLPEKGLLEKSPTIKGFEYLLIGSKLKNQTIIAEKQYQKFEGVEELTTKNNKEPTIKKYNRSNLIYNEKFTFYECNDINKFHKLSFESKLSRLNEFSNHLEKLRNPKAIKQKNKRKKKY